jgi:hypothetical protein
MVPVEDFGLEGSSPEQELVSQRAVDADCVNLGSHKPSLTPAHDVKIAQSTEQKGTGRCDAAHLPLAESNWLSSSSIKDRWNLQALVRGPADYPATRESRISECEHKHSDQRVYEH